MFVCLIVKIIPADWVFRSLYPEWIILWNIHLQKLMNCFYNSVLNDNLTILSNMTSGLVQKFVSAHLFLSGATKLLKQTNDNNNNKNLSQRTSLSYGNMAAKEYLNNLFALGYFLKFFFSWLSPWKFCIHTTSRVFRLPVWSMKSWQMVG